MAKSWETVCPFPFQIFKTLCITSRGKSFPTALCIDKNPSPLMDPEDYRLNDPHDRFFKETFGRLEFAIPVLQEALPEDIRSAVDWDKLRPVEKEFLDETLRKRAGDLLFEAPWRDCSLLIQILFEHQSTVDHWEPLRLLRYLLLIWEGWRKRFPNKKKLPLIIPIVFYQGADGWNAARDLQALISIPPSPGETWRSFVPTFSYGLLDVQELKNNPRFESWKLNHLMTLLADIFTTADDHRLQRAFQTLNDLIAAGANDGAFIRAIITYLYHVSASVDKETFRKHTLILKSPKIQQNAMTIAEQLHQQGRNEGRVEQGQQSILDFLSERFGEIPEGLKEAIGGIHDPQKLRQLTRASATCTSVEHFTDSL
jgi:predicted transposase/invertase (TIGR01784 family)